MSTPLEVKIRRKAREMGLRLVKDYGNPPLYGVVNRYVKHHGESYNETYIFELEEIEEYLDALAEDGVKYEDKVAWKT